MKLFYIAVLAMIISAGSFCRTSSCFAQSSGRDTLVWFWHCAYFAEIHGDFDSAIADYRNVMQFSDDIPPRLREWYLGTCNFGIARMYSIMGDEDECRAALDSAMSHHFWNFAAIRAVPTFALLLGDKWMDSVCAEWKSVRDREEPTWPVQPVIELVPTHLDPQKKYPVIMALHGGNGSYELFARRLSKVPDALNVIVAVVPGVLRTSEITNEWDTAMIFSEERVRESIALLAKNPNVDTNDITLLGFSQGSQVSYAYCVDHPDEIHSVIAFAGFAPEVLAEKDLNSELDSVAKRKIKIVAVSGAEDSPDFLKSTHELEQRAKEHGVEFEMKIEPKLPHGIPRHLAHYLRNLWSELRGNSLGTR
ncbi:MAG TPA: alpha/beta fold hydrolase [Candidatus Kapabacteria bacterium]|nr:alpha/beta fold hydrolase [Candidatus Kapabacteria bacterium]